MSLEPAPELSWELIRKKNYVERIKHEKAPFDLLPELPALVARGYEEVSEEDVVRLQWSGLYHDKPKVGFFMMRVKVPGGVITPVKLRALSGLSREFGGGYGEITTRQCLQLHNLAFGSLPEILGRLAAAGMTTASACGDTVRNLTGCPVSGLLAEELFDVRPVLEEVSAFFTGQKAWGDLPRKHKITLAACPHQCNAPEIHCIALVGTVSAERPGFAVRVGGGLATWPRLADDLGVFVPVEQVLPVLAALVEVWKEDLESRRSRARARFKFLVDRIGVPTLRQEVEKRLGRRLEDGSVPQGPVTEQDHVGVAAQKEPGRFVVGFPVFLGLIDAGQMAALADLAEPLGLGIRFTRRQNFLLTDVPAERLDGVIDAVGMIGFPLASAGLRGSSIACTGEPFCNFAVAETKHKLAEIVRHLESVFGDKVAGLRLNLDGCPNACAHHWIGDIGLQGTTLRERGPAGERLRGYDLFLRGGLGRDAAIGRPVFRRVPATEVHLVIERLLSGYFAEQEPGESIPGFFRRLTDEQLLALGGLASECELAASA